MRAHPAPTLVISGGHEFYPDAAPDLAVTPPPQTSPDTLRQLYARTRTDVGYAGAGAVAFFAGQLPAGFSAVGTVPVVRRLQVGSVRLAVVLFPPATDATRERLCTALLDAAATVRDVDLVVGVSPWGFRLEGMSLARLAEGFDVLLGSGEGAPFPFEVPTFAPGIIWSRADRDARSITELSLYTLPGPQAGRPRTWLAHVDAQGVEHPLGMHITEADFGGLIPPDPASAATALPHN